MHAFYFYNVSLLESGTENSSDHFRPIWEPGDKASSAHADGLCLLLFVCLQFIVSWSV